MKRSEESKKLEKILLFFFMLFEAAFVGGVSPQSFQESPPSAQWNKTFGGPDGDLAYSVQQTLDGGYIVGGSTKLDGLFSGWLVKTDASGSHQWNKTYKEECCKTYQEGSFSQITSVQQTSDGGYILLARLLLPPKSGAWLIKTDATGDFIWNRTFWGASDASYVQPTSDGGYVLDSGNLIIKVDASGNQQWNFSIWNTFGNIVTSLRQTSDIGYIITAGAWIIKIDASGNQQWNKTFGTSMPPWYSFNDIQQTSDGGYILAGTEDSDNGLLVKIDTNGNHQWNKTFRNWIGLNMFNSVQQTSDGSYIVAGVADSYGGGRDAWLVKVDAGGSPLWNLTVGGESQDTANAIRQTSDGGYILAGSTSSYGAGGSDIWLLKLSKSQKQTCLDGTAYGSCSVNRPKYCADGNQIDKASICGCTADYDVSGDSCTKQPHPDQKEKATEPVPIVKAVPLNTPSPISPGSQLESSASEATLAPRFEWYDVSGADYYGINISKYPYGGDNGVYSNEMIIGSLFTLPSGVLKEGEKYRWNMRAHNGAGWSSYSDKLYFQTPSHTGQPPETSNVPQITTIEPIQPEAQPLTSKQWVRLIGTNFLEDSSTVVLNDGNQDYPPISLKTDRERFKFVDSGHIDVYVGLTPGPWSIYVVNSDRKSNVFTFNVRPNSIVVAVARLALQCWDRSNATIAVAIAGGESKWNSSKHGDSLDTLSNNRCSLKISPQSSCTSEKTYNDAKAFNCDKYASWGLWQVLMSEHKDKDGVLSKLEAPVDDPCKTAEWLRDPNNNMKAAYAIYERQSFTAWTVYTNHYKDKSDWQTYFNHATKAVETVEAESKATGAFPQPSGSCDFPVKQTPSSKTVLGETSTKQGAIMPEEKTKKIEKTQPTKPSEPIKEEKTQSSSKTNSIFEKISNTISTFFGWFKRK